MNTESHSQLAPFIWSVADLLRGDFRQSLQQLEAADLLYKVVESFATSRASKTPAYLEAHAAPRHPIDLKAHNCLVMRFGQNLDNEWHFETPEGPQIVTEKGNRVANDGAMVRQWGLEGLGIVLKSELDAVEDIRRGRADPPGL